MKIYKKLEKERRNLELREGGYCTSAVEKNLLEKNTNKATSANNKKSEILKTGASATIPVNQPGSEVY